MAPQVTIKPLTTSHKKYKKIYIGKINPTEHQVNRKKYFTFFFNNFNLKGKFLYSSFPTLLYSSAIVVIHAIIIIGSRQNTAVYRYSIHTHIYIYIYLKEKRKIQIKKKYHLYRELLSLMILLGIWGVSGAYHQKNNKSALNPLLFFYLFIVEKL